MNPMQNGKETINFKDYLSIFQSFNLEPTLKSLRRKKIGYPSGVCRIVLGWSFSTDRIPLRGMHI
jgi:hypothetical protein